MDKRVVLFSTFFIILLVINSYIYRFIFKELIFTNIPVTWLDITNIMTILIYLIAIIPLTAFLSEKIVKSYLKEPR
ncbi:hypothetical protein ACM26V_03880 [Salipaludibacillus sp. HK11]|uniref:hypothetical protein n=1 Tax=Salipaludibacillus sp. HK11 TaxID=3394320 RepID=UPI0039FBCD75